MHGLGNDFVVLDGREQPIAMTPALAKALADRHLGIGCDQLILLEKSDKADVKMRIWNHDGGEVQSCGNASRCVVALTGAKSLETGGGIVEGGTFGAEVEVSLPPPHFAWDEVCDWYVELAKISLAGPSAGVTRRVLGEVLDTLLRLLHPMIPFATEALWTALTGGESVVVAAWPSADTARCVAM